MPSQLRLLASLVHALTRGGAVALRATSVMTAVPFLAWRTGNGARREDGLSGHQPILPETYL
jgi:hypothetical protein